MGGWVDEWVGGWVGGWMGGLVGGFTLEENFIFSPLILCSGSFFSLSINVCLYVC